MRDIAAVAATALTEPWHLQRTYAITGPQGLSRADVAAALSRAWPRGAFCDVAPEAFAAAMAASGIAPCHLDGPLEDYARYRRARLRWSHPPHS